jgi:multiple sugar transport system permease protein
MTRSATTGRPASRSKGTDPPGTPGGPAARRPRRSQRSAYLFLSPWLIGVALLTVGPMVASLYLSFTDYDLFDPPRWVGLHNYVAMFTSDDRFRHASWVTVKYVALAVPLKLALALAVALLLNRPHRGQGVYRAGFYGPSLLGASVSLALVWRAMFNDGGAVDRVLSAFGLHTGGWVDRPQYALLALVALAVWQFGAPMVIFLAGLKQVPRELYDAAATDGAGRLRTFWSVTLPLLSPVLLFNIVLETIHAFQAFTGAFVISNGRGGPGDSTLLYTLYLYQRGFTDFRMGYASAMAWVLLLAIGAVTVVLFRLARIWVFYSGEDQR